VSKKSRNVLKLHASKKRPDRKLVAEAVRAAIGNPGTSADPLASVHTRLAQAPSD